MTINHWECGKTQATAGETRSVRAPLGGDHDALTTDGVQDADVRQLSLGAERVNGRSAHSEVLRGSCDGEQNILDPSWTPKFVFLRCGLGDSGSWLWCRRE
jgi:hypothetical protein